MKRIRDFNNINETDLIWYKPTNRLGFIKNGIMFSFNKLLDTSMLKNEWQIIHTDDYFILTKGEAMLKMLEDQSLT